MLFRSDSTLKFRSTIGLIMGKPWENEAGIVNGLPGPRDRLEAYLTVRLGVVGLVPRTGCQDTFPVCKKPDGFRLPALLGALSRQ
jgi:hypothetical protein